MAKAMRPHTLEEREEEKEEEEEEEGFSLVWRPLVTRFSRDPEMIYWVPPLYYSQSLRSQESLTQRSSKSSILERREHLSSGQEDFSAFLSQQKLTDTTYALDSSLSSQGSSHLYETIKCALSPHGRPGSFSAANDSRIEQNYFFYEQEKTFEEELRHPRFKSTSTSNIKNEEAFYSCITTKVGQFADSSDGKSLCEFDSVKQNVRQRPTNSSSTPQKYTTWPKEYKMAAFSEQGGRRGFEDDPEALHCWAAANLHSQATLHLEGEEKVCTSQDKLCLEQNCCRCIRHEHFTQADVYHLNKYFYILSVIILLLLGVVIIVVIMSARYKT